MSQTIHLRLDEDGRPSLNVPRPIRFVGKQLVTLVVLVEQLIISSLPPAYTPVDISTWTGVLLGKRDVNDDDTAALWEVTGTLIDGGVTGKMSFAIASADDTLEVDYGYGEISLSSGSDVIYKMPFPFTVTRSGLGA